MALTSQTETTELVKTALRSLENEIENELTRNAFNIVALDRMGSEMMFEVGWYQTRCVVSQLSLFFLNHLYSGVQALGPDRSQTSYNNVECAKVGLLHTRFSRLMV